MLQFIALAWVVVIQSLVDRYKEARTRKSGCTFCEHSCSSILYCLRSYPIDSSELLQLGHNYSQQWTTLATYENAHSSGQRSQLTKTLTALKKMLTFYENACSQLTKNSAHNSGKCSQLANMLTTYRNAHNSEKCSQLANMLTTYTNAHNSEKCSQLANMLTTYRNTHNSAP